MFTGRLAGVACCSVLSWVLLLIGASPLVAQDKPGEGQPQPMLPQCQVDCPPPTANIIFLAHTFSPTVRSPASGPFTYTVTLQNVGFEPGTVYLWCTSSSPQLPCLTPTPESATIPAGATADFTLGYMTLGLGVSHQTIHFEMEPGPQIDSLVLGNVSVQGPAIISHTAPLESETVGLTDSLLGFYQDPSGINTLSLKVFLNGVDRSTRIVAKTSSSFKVRLDSLTGGTYRWSSYVCANGGRCDSLTTNFELVGPTSFAMDDSLPATYTGLGSGGLIGPLPELVPDSLRGCPINVGYPLMYFSQPLSYVTQSAPYGQAYIATIDTLSGHTTVSTTSQAWRTDSKVCDQVPILDAAQFNYNYFGSLPPNDPHWLSYGGAFLTLESAPGSGAEPWFENDAQLAFGPTGHGPNVGPSLAIAAWGQAGWARRRSGVAGTPSRAGAVQAAPMTSRASAMLPDPGPINPATYKLTLNGEVVVDHAVAVSGSGVVVEYVTNGFQRLRIPTTHPAYRTTTFGGWNELVATISDSQGRPVSIRTRFVHEAGGGAGLVAPLAVKSLRDFIHSEQGNCAAFGPFQCDGVTLAYALPGFVTRDRERSVHLVYRSASQRVPTIIPLRLDILKANKAPDSLWVTPKIGSALDLTKRTRYAGVVGPVSGPNASNIGEGRDEQRIVATEVAAPLSGVVAITTVTSIVRSWFVPGNSQPYRDDSVSQDVVQVHLTEQTASRFGQGWQLAELGRLVLTNSSGGGLQFNGATAAVWLSGDGSYTVFRKPASTWLSPAGQTARLVVELLNGAAYVLYLETGASIGFRADGWQVWTRDLVGNFTNFWYQATPSNQLDSIGDPAGKKIKFTYYPSGKRSGFAQFVKLNVGGVGAPDTTVAAFDYDTISNPSAVRLSRIRVLTTAADTSTTRFTYFGASAPGAFIDSVIDPRHTTAKPVVSRFLYNATLWTPERVTNPLGQPDQYRSVAQRAAPRNGYGRPAAGNPLERTIALVQYVGTFAPLGTISTDYTVDRFAAPNFVRRNGANPSQNSVRSDDTRHIERDTLTGLPLRIVHNRYAPTQSDSVVFHYDAFWRVDTLKRTTLEFKLTGQTRTLDTLTFTYDTATIVSGKQWCSRLRTARDPMGGVSTAFYSASGVGRCLPDSLAGIAGEVTRFKYGSLTAGSSAGARPVKVTDPANLMDSVSYHAGTWNSEYQVRQADAAVTRAFYNASGRADSILDPVGVVTRVRYDRWGRATHQQTGTGPATRSIYDKGGLVTQVDVYQPATGDFTVLGTNVQTTTTAYNQMGWADSLVGPGGRTVAPNGFKARKQSWSGFDRFGNSHWSYSGNGTYVAKIFDGMGRVTRIDMSAVTAAGTFGGEAFASTATKAWLNNFMLPLGKAQNAGVTHTLTYDDKGRLATSKSRDPYLPDPDVLGYHPDYVEQSYAYSKADALVTETTAFHDGATVVRRYEYNRRGQRTQAVDSSFGSGIPSGEGAGKTRYVYNDNTARLDSIVATTGTNTPYARIALQYDAAGRQAQRTLMPGATGPNELVTTTTYDAVGRLGGVGTVNSGSSPKTWYAFSTDATSYDKVDDLKLFGYTEPRVETGSTTLTYATDGTRRLLSSNRVRYDGATALFKAWNYDFWGNRIGENGLSSFPELTSCLGARTLTYDRDNRVLTRGAIPGQSSCGQSVYYTDQAGNRLGEADPTVTSDPPTVQLRSLSTYNAANQLYFSLTPSGSQADMSWNWYDARGRRAEAQLRSGGGFYPIPHPDSVGGYRTYYVYDGNDVALELTRVNGANTWRVDRRLVSGGLDAPLAGRFWIVSGYKDLGLVSDRSGTILAAVNGAGTEENSGDNFHRDAFGALVGVTGSGGQPVGGAGFTGAGTPNARGGFVYLRNRWYDPQTGRFLTQDPIGLAGGVNLYAYAGNNPIGFSDPFGLAPCCTWLKQAWENLRNFVRDVAAMSPEEHRAAARTAAGLASAGMQGTLMAGALSEGRPAMMDPNSIRFSQNSIKGTFQDGGSVSGLAADLKSGAVDPATVSPIRLVERDGQLFTLDNRRLAAFQRAGVQVPSRMATPEEAAAAGWKFTTRNEGTSIKIRGEP